MRAIVGQFHQKAQGHDTDMFAKATLKGEKKGRQEGMEKGMHQAFPKP